MPLQESPAKVAEYDENLKLFAEDGVIEDWERDELHRLRREFGISKTTHQTLLAKYKPLAERLPLALFIDETTFKDFIEGARGVVRARLFNAGYRPLKHIDARYNVGREARVRSHETSILGPQRGDVFQAALDFQQAGQYSLEAVLRAEDTKGRAQYYRATPLGFSVGAPASGGPQNLTLNVDNSGSAAINEFDLGGSPARDGGRMARARWQEVPLKGISKEEWEEWIIDRDPKERAAAEKRLAEQRLQQQQQQERERQREKEQQAESKRAQELAIAQAKAAENNAEAEKARIQRQRELQQLQARQQHEEQERALRLAEIEAQAHAQAEAEQRAAAVEAQRVQAQAEAEERARQDEVQRAAMEEARTLAKKNSWRFSLLGGIAGSVFCGLLGGILGNGCSRSGAPALAESRAALRSSYSPTLLADACNHTAGHLANRKRVEKQTLELLGKIKGANTKEAIAAKLQQRGIAVPEGSE